MGCIMRSGRLDRRVTIQTLTETLDKYGDPVQSWVDQVTVWASVQPLRGDEPFENQQTLSKATTKFRIRYNSDITITVKHRLVLDSVNYDIIHIAQRGTRGIEYWEIMGELVQ